MGVETFADDPYFLYFMDREHFELTIGAMLGEYPPGYLTRNKATTKPVIPRAAPRAKGAT